MQKEKVWLQSETEVEALSETKPTSFEKEISVDFVYDLVTDSPKWHGRDSIPCVCTTS